MAALPEVIEFEDIRDTVGCPAARRLPTLRISDHGIEVALFELRLDRLADNLLRTQGERHEIEQVPAVDHDTAVGQVGVHDNRPARRLGLGCLPDLGQQVPVARITVVRIAHRSHQPHLPAVERLDSGFHVFHGHEVEPHLRLLARHVGHTGILTPLSQIKAALVTDVVETEIPLLGFLAECPEHPLGDGNVVDPGGNRLEHSPLENQVGILLVHPGDPGFGIRKPGIVHEIALLVPLVHRTPDEFGTDVEQHPFIVLRPVDAVGRGLGAGQELGLGNGPRKVVMQHFFGHHTVRKLVVARVGYGIWPPGDLGPLAFIPLFFAPCSREHNGCGAKYHFKGFHRISSLKPRPARNRPELRSHSVTIRRSYR